MTSSGHIQLTRRIPPTHWAQLSLYEIDIIASLLSSTPSSEDDL